MEWRRILQSSHESQKGVGAMTDQLTVSCNVTWTLLNAALKVEAVWSTVGGGITQRSLDRHPCSVVSCGLLLPKAAATQTKEKCSISVSSHWALKPLRFFSWMAVKAIHAFHFERTL
jgi:hypothetical protein